MKNKKHLAKGCHLKWLPGPGGQHQWGNISAQSRMSLREKPGLGAGQMKGHSPIWRHSQVSCLILCGKVGTKHQNQVQNWNQSHKQNILKAASYQWGPLSLTVARSIALIGKKRNATTGDDRKDRTTEENKIKWKE